MPSRTSDLTTFDAFAIAGMSIAISEGIGRLTDTALPVVTAFCVLSLGLAAKMCWPLHGRRWFLPLFLLVAVIHVPVAVLASRISINGFYLMLVPFVGLDVFLIIWCALKIDDRIA